MDRTFQDTGEGIQVGDIIMSRGLFAFHLGDKTVGKVELERKIHLRKTSFHTKLFDGMDHIPVEGRDLFDGLLGSPGGCFCRLFHT